MKPEPLKNKRCNEDKELEYYGYREIYFKEEDVKLAVEYLKDLLGGECDDEVNEAFEDVMKR